MKRLRCIFQAGSSQRALRSTGAVGILAICLLGRIALGADQEVTKLIKETVAGAPNSAEAAERLMKVAVLLGDTPKAQVMFYRTAYEYGVKTTSGQDIALKAINILIRIDPENADEWGDKRITLYRMMYARSKPDKKLAAGIKLVALLRDLAEANAKNKQWNTALKHFNSAMRIAVRLKLSERTEIADRIREITLAMNRSKRLESLKQKLIANPNDDSTRNEIIQTCLLEYDSPTRAAKFVSEDGDETLRTYIPMAAKSLDKLTEASCLELAQWYQSLVPDTAVKARKIVAMDRAISYLQRYLELHAKQDIASVKARNTLNKLLVAIRKLEGGLMPPGAVLVISFEKRTFSTRGRQAYILDASKQRLKGLVSGGTLVPGRAGQAMKFDGKAYLDFGNPKALQIVGNQTICMWLKPANLSARQNPLNKAYGGECTWTIELSGAINYICGSAGKNSQPHGSYGMSKPLKPGKWAHLAVTRDIKTKKVIWYKDGELVSLSALKYRPSASKSPLLIGKGYTRNYQGLMDELAIFNRALSAKEIKGIYLMGEKGLSLK